MAKKQCKTCAHWRWIRNENYECWPGPHGECGLIWHLSYDNVPAWVAGGEGNDDDLSLITKPEFGCVLWKNAVDTEVKDGRKDYCIEKEISIP